MPHTSRERSEFKDMIKNMKRKIDGVPIPVSAGKGRWPKISPCAHSR